VHSSGSDEVCEGSTKSKRRKANTQKRYDPEVPMSKEEAKAWRAAARRVRNRESAAASREKTRSRIAELEGEVEAWKTKYYELLEQMQKPEEEAVQSQESHEEYQSCFVSPCPSPPPSSIFFSLLPSYFPSDHSIQDEAVYDEQHIIETISRPA